MEIRFLTLPNGKCPSEDFLDKLDNKTLAKVYKLLERLEAKEKLLYPHARKLEGYKNLWELRIKSQQGAIRVFYAYWEKNTIMLISGFVKKSQKTPKRELDKAMHYLQQVGIKL